MSARSCLGFIVNAFVRKKHVDATHNALNTKLNRCLTTLDLTLIGVGSTLGAGVYVLTGDVAKYKAGPGISLSFLIAAVASVLAGVCYAEFGARVPRAGSAYVYTYVTAGELCGFIVGWNMLLEYGIGGAAVAKGLSSYLDAAVDHKMSKFFIEKTGQFNILGQGETYYDFFAFTLCVLTTIFISLGVKNTSRLNNLCTITNILVIVMVITMGAFYVDFKNWSNFAPFGVHGIVSGASSCFFAFIGFDAVATIGEEAARPSRSIPLAIVGTIIICFLAYVGVAGVVTLMVNYKDLFGDAALSKAFENHGNHAAKYIVSTGAIIGLTGTTIVSLMPIPRLLYSMAKDGLVFRVLARINSKTDTPVIATIVTGVVTATMALLIKLHDLIEMVSIGTLLAYTFVVVSVLMLRYHPTDIGLSKGVLSRSVSPVGQGLRSASHSPFIHSISARAEGEHGDFTCKTPPFLDTPADPDSSLPTEKTYFIVMCCLVTGILAIIGISVVVTLWEKKLQDKDPLLLTLLCVLILGVVASMVIVWLQPQSQQQLYFKAPLLPWLPFLSIFCNIYLMVSLNKLTWIRFAVWMVVGFTIYFGYGILHSVERDRQYYEAIEDLEHEDS